MSFAHKLHVHSIAQIMEALFVFYDVYCELCRENGEKPYSLPLKLGMKSNSAVTQWKNGSIPRMPMLKKIADYFGVTVGYLMGADEDEDKKGRARRPEGRRALGGVYQPIPTSFRRSEEFRSCCDARSSKREMSSNFSDRGSFLNNSAAIFTSAQDMRSPFPFLTPAEECRLRVLLV